VALLPGYLPSILGLAARFSLIAANDLKWLNPIIITGIAFNLACNLLFAGSGPEGLTVIGTVITLTSWLMLGLFALVMWRSKRIPNGVLGRKAGLAVRNVLALGIPVGAIFFTETLLFTGSSLLMGYFGKVALAAHGIVLLWLNIALMMPIGLSSAAMARVAFLLGQRDLVALKHAVVVSLVVGSAVSIVIGALLVANSDSLVRLAMWSRSGGSEAVIEDRARLLPVLRHHATDVGPRHRHGQHPARPARRQRGAVAGHARLLGRRSRRRRLFGSRSAWAHRHLARHRAGLRLRRRAAGDQVFAGVRAVSAGRSAGVGSCRAGSL
jgi:Na+-driven multidrug efflux pump